MTETEEIESDTNIRSYWNRRAENVQNDEQLADFLAHLLVVDTNTFQIALPTLCVLAAGELSEQRKREFEEICASVLLDPESSRPSRRAVLACLKEFRFGSAWTDFYTLVEALEEPQFHIIRPILPRFDTLLTAVFDNKLDFVWAKIALLRAILHTNGWIRVWAIEKSVSIDTEVLKKHHNFITQLLIPNLNNNDVFWRHLEKGRMEENLQKLGEVLEAVKSAPSFIQNLLEAIQLLSCPTAFFFVVSTLRNVSSEEILSSEDVPLMRRAVLAARYIPHKSMRITTIRNLVIFYAKVTKLDETVLEELANLIAYFSSDSTPQMVDATFKELQEILTDAAYKSPEHQDERFFAEEYGKKTKNFNEHARMFWVSMGDTERQEKILGRLQLEVSEMLAEKPVREDLTMQLYLLKEQPDGLNGSSDVLSLMSNDLGEYILTRVISSRGTRTDALLLDTLYIPLFLKYCSQVFRFPFALALIQIAPETKNCEALALHLTFLDRILVNATSEDVLASGFFSYLEGKDVIGMRRQKKSIEEFDTKDFNRIVATVHSLRIKLLNRFTKSVDDVDAFLLECIEQLDVASAFSVKQQICHLISRFIHDSKDPSLPLQCIRACSNIVNEEKKSLNSLPALQCFVDVAIRGPERNAKEIIEMLETQMAIANQSTPVALILVDSLTKYRTNLTTEWAPFLVKLALFGPVPKKESRVISFAYSKMFDEEDGLLEKDQIERLDEVVQKARFKAVLLALKLSDEHSATWPVALIEEIFNASAVMDQSSSRSFGLSMAHRQKTRAVELLHLLAVKIEEEAVAERIFDFCIACVVDPCQQFSIKLIVEWTLARICIKFEKIFQKIVDKEFETRMAAQRIGSMCSWLNVLMLISRAAPSLTETCLDKIIVWCTAQNFPVRCTALAAARLMFSTFDKDKRKKWRLVKAIVNFDSEPSGNSKRVVDNLCNDFYFAKLHVDQHFDFQTILTEIAKRTGMPPEETIPESIIRELNDSNVPSFNEDLEFLNAPSEVYSALSKNASCAPSMENEDATPEDQNQDSEDKVDDLPAVSASFQRKIVKDQEQKDDGISLIVVASLVDKPNNLGGICRTSEIFGVDTLVVADVLVAQDSNFKALSMSSENWQKIEGVKPANLLPYLQNLRANGYTVIAAEQTTDSVMMHDFVFPKKAVIVMGDEKEGVPVNLLRAVDQTVEIKQVGHTRSLNVHVTAALMIAKFAEQVRFAPRS